jgi:predicted branched-subunit amino acid permease
MLGIVFVAVAAAALEAVLEAAATAVLVVLAVRLGQRDQMGAAFDPAAAAVLAVVVVVHFTVPRIASTYMAAAVAAVYFREQAEREEGLIRI